MNNSQADFDSIWSRLNDSIKLQHVEVKASFERSLTCIQHDFKVRLFDNLRGAVSQTAMALMMPEISKIDDTAVKPKGDCGCPIRRTHGLPCAHLITPFKHDNLPIPLDLIDDHWKRLCLDSKKQQDSIINLMRADFEVFLDKVKDFKDQTLDHWRKHLKGFYHPSTSSLKEPKTKAVTRGRKAGSLNKSMRRDPSYFEHVERSTKTPKSVEKGKNVERSKPTVSARKSSTVKPSSMKTNSKDKAVVVKNISTPPTVNQPPRKKPKLVRNLFSAPYADQFPEPIVGDFMHTTDVERDGNCGFRVVALHWTGSQNEWSICRERMIKEVQNNQDLYDKVTGMQGGATELCHRFEWHQHHVIAPTDKWMSFPNAGHVVASAYNTPVVFLSLRQCLTFLPLRSPPHL